MPSKLPSEQIEEIRELRADGVPVDDVAEELEISPSTVLKYANEDADEGDEDPIFTEQTPGIGDFIEDLEAVPGVGEARVSWIQRVLERREDLINQPHALHGLLTDTGVPERAARTLCAMHARAPPTDSAGGPLVGRPPQGSTGPLAASAPSPSRRPWPSAPQADPRGGGVDPDAVAAAVERALDDRLSPSASERGPGGIAQALEVLDRLGVLDDGNESSNLDRLAEVLDERFQDLARLILRATQDTGNPQAGGDIVDRVTEQSEKLARLRAELEAERARREAEREAREEIEKRERELRDLESQVAESRGDMPPDAKILDKSIDEGVDILKSFSRNADQRMARLEKLLLAGIQAQQGGGKQANVSGADLADLAALADREGVDEEVLVDADAEPEPGPASVSRGEPEADTEPEPEGEPGRDPTDLDLGGPTRKSAGVDPITGEPVIADDEADEGGIDLDAEDAHRAAHRLDALLEAAEDDDGDHEEE